MWRGLSILAVVGAASVAAVAAPAGAGVPSVTASAYTVRSSLDGTTLFAHRANAPLPMASITKLMTALVVRRSARLDAIVVVRPAATRVGESSVRLRAGQRLSVRDLLAATLIPSANDAATALALHVGRGSQQRFVARMNATARTLGLTGTRYRNPHGLDQRGHVSTARDSAVLLRAVLCDPLLRRLVGARQARLSNGTLVRSTDNLIGAVPGFIGGKTGHTTGAGWSQVAAARRDGVTITAAVLGSDGEAARDADLAALLRAGLASFRRSRVVDPGRVYASVEVGWGLAPLALVAPRALVRVAGTGRPLVETVVAPFAVELPVVAGARLGTLTVRDGSRIVARSPLVAARSATRPGGSGRVRAVAGRTMHDLRRWASR